MNILDDPLFKALYNNSVSRLILKADAPDFTIIDYNDAYKADTFIGNKNIRGESLWQIYNPQDAGGDGPSLLSEAMLSALSLQETVAMPPFKYDIPSAESGKMKPSWWQLEITPISEDGSVAYLLLTIHSLTAQMNAEQAKEEAILREQNLQERLAATNEELMATNEELTASLEELQKSQTSLQEVNQTLEERVERRTHELKMERQRLSSIISSVPEGLAVLNGPEMSVEMANDYILKIWGREQTILHQPILEIMPEIRSQGFADLLEQVYLSGKAYYQQDAPVNLVVHGELKLYYMDFAYTPLKNEHGETNSILVMAEDVTERSLARQREQQLTEELTATNEEIAAANEELSVTIEELDHAQQTLQTTVNQLKDSEGRFINLIRDASVGIIVLSDTNQRVLIVNNAYAKMIGRKPSELYNEYLFEIIPEAASYFKPIIDQVLLSGEAVYLYDTPYSVNVNNEEVQGYLNVVYQPYREQGGDITGVMILCQDVTEQVRAKHELQDSEERFRLIAEGTEVMIALGDETGAAVYFNQAWSDLTGRTAEELYQFGWMDMMHPDDKDRVTKIFNDALAKQDTWEWEFRMPDRRNGYLWLLARGIPRFRTDGAFLGYISSTIDITARKQEEQRKNDFISMVSHELKTPLTSMSAYMQMLLAKARKADDNFSAKTLERAGKQVTKMTAMINGFLNVSRLESSGIHIEKSSFDMADLVRDVEEESIATISTHDVVFAPVLTTMVMADRNKIGQVINNFLTNAVKYSPSGSNINIACVTIGNSALVSVQDQGVGITSEDQPKLFDRFYRVKNQQAHTIPGFGIGLYLSAEIINSHEGRIWVESEVGKGSTFFFSIPLES